MRDEYTFEMMDADMYRVTRIAGQDGQPYVIYAGREYVGQREAQLISEGYSVWSSNHFERIYVRD